jgi:predicted MPP superfamily phosphohydrolase
MSRRRHPTDARPDERRAPSADRRDDATRHQLELLLDRVFRPARWLSRAAYVLGLQSGRPIVVTHHEIVAPGRVGRPPLRIAFASDFHAGATTDPRVLRAACAALESLNPDVLLLGGDFVSVRGADIQVLAPLLGTVEAPLGRFGVWGNHDLRANRPEVASALGEAGVRLLDDEIVTLAAPHDDVTIVGLDDPILGDPDGSLLDHASGVRILLMHAPDGLLAAGPRHFDVALCGHTHGGQIVLPGGYIPYLPHGALSRDYPVGEYVLDADAARTLIVSRGVGCSTVPFRVGCAAEVHLVTLSGESTSAGADRG